MTLFSKRGSLRACLLGAALGALAWPGLAMADWYRADSDHFVVYADDRASDIEEFTSELERFHGAMALTTGGAVTVPSPSNRVTIFMVRSEREVRELYDGNNSKYVGGFYVARAGGSIAIVPRIGTGSTETDFAMITLLHEYAHHFLISSGSQQMPRWVSEGGAEFFASASFLRDGGVWIGRAAQHRGYELYNAETVPVEELLDPAVYEKRNHKGYDAFYGKAWLLYHYLTFSEERRGQLGRYLAAIAKGKGERAAAEEVFGDFKQLERELGRYLRQSRILAVRLEADRLPIGAIRISQLTEGEAKVMPSRIRSQRGVDQETAKAVLDEVRAVAKSYPDDPGVLTALAEAEHDAHNYDESVVAADAAIARDPSRVNAYVQKGYSLFAKAQTDDGSIEHRAALYKAARAPFVALNRIENDHPLPLLWYYRSFAMQGKEPNELAIRGIERASELAPFDLGLQMETAMALLPRHYPELVAFHLRPVAYNPHGGSETVAAAAVLAKIEADPEWDGKDVGQVMADAMRKAQPETATEGETAKTGATKRD